MGRGDGRGAWMAVRRSEHARLQRRPPVQRQGVLRRERRGRAHGCQRVQVPVPVRAHPARGLFPGNLRHRDLPGGGEQQGVRSRGWRGSHIVPDGPCLLPLRHEQVHRVDIPRRAELRTRPVLQEAQGTGRHHRRRG